jgi:vancomycin resistance protein YoaR
MKNRMIGLILALVMISAMVCGALAEQRYSARTSLKGASDAQRENIRLAVKALNGAEVDEGERFSFNETVGPRTRTRGYLKAENGRGAMVTGGGVAQAATTLYLALMKLGDDIDYHGLSVYGQRFTGDYVADGDLAVITDYSAGTDFSFTNNAGDMDMEFWISGDYLNCAVTVGSDSGSWFIDWGGDSGAGKPKVYDASIDLEDCDDDTLHNIELAADSVNDTTLAPGDRFSFNKVVGPRSGRYGYGSGTNGRGKRVTGGGVAQVASAIWLAVKDMDDIAVIEKSTYGSKYNQTYVDSSADAIVTDYKAGTDFFFRYTGDGSVTIYTYIEDDELKCSVAVYEN